MILKSWRESVKNGFIVRRLKLNDGLSIDALSFQEKMTLAQGQQIRNI